MQSLNLAFEEVKSLLAWGMVNSSYPESWIWALTPRSIRVKREMGEGTEYQEIEPGAIFSLSHWMGIKRSLLLLFCF
jgi:hypothetical protein